MSASNFPTKLADFSGMLSVLIKYIPNNAIRLQIDPALVNKFISLYGDNSTDGTWCYYWLKYSDQKVKRTTLIKDELRATQREIKELLMSIYSSIPASLWTDKDRLIFNRKTGLPHKIHRHVVNIQEGCLLYLRPIGGGSVRVVCIIPDEFHRARLPEKATALEIAWRLDFPKPPDSLVGSSERYEILRNWTDGTTTQIFTKASFILRLGGENAGCVMQCFVRWINLRHRQLDGHWAGPFSTFIL
jgi:hypothetical protein